MVEDAAFFEDASDDDLRSPPLSAAPLRAPDADDDAGWPHIQRLGDAIRCTIECDSAAAMLESWNQLRGEFGLDLTANSDCFTLRGEFESRFVLQERDFCLIPEF